jgi:hypothetical protein
MFYYNNESDEVEYSEMVDGDLIIFRFHLKIMRIL